MLNNQVSVPAHLLAHVTLHYALQIRHICVLLPVMFCHS
jgi:hypothetical protein